jgi:hypothetical protein
MQTFSKYTLQYNKTDQLFESSTYECSPGIIIDVDVDEGEVRSQLDKIIKLDQIASDDVLIQKLI